MTSGEGACGRNDFMKRWMAKKLVNLWLSNRIQRSTSSCSFSLAGYMFFPPEESGYEWAKSNPNLHAWIERMRALPGWKDPYELMPGERIKPLR